MEPWGTPKFTFLTSEHVSSMSLILIYCATFATGGTLEKNIPDTPIRGTKLYDFVKFLEKATKLRTLRPAFPLREIEKLTNGNRPIKVYSKVEVLIIDFCKANEPSFAIY